MSKLTDRRRRSNAFTKNNKEHFAKRNSGAVSLVEIFVQIYRKNLQRKEIKWRGNHQWACRFFFFFPLKDMGLIYLIMSELTEK